MNKWMNLYHQWHSKVAIPIDAENVWWEIIMDKYLRSVGFDLIIAALHNYHTENAIFSRFSISFTFHIYKFTNLANIIKYLKKQALWTHCEYNVSNVK